MRDLSQDQHRRDRIQAMADAFNLDADRHADDAWRSIGDAARDVLTELADRAAIVPPLWRKRLIAERVDRKSILGLGEHGRTNVSGIATPSPLYSARVVFLNGERFEWARSSDCDEAVPALAGLCHDQDGYAIDIFATSPRTGQIGVLEGRAGVIDESELFRSRIADELIVHADLLSWLRAGRVGCFVVNWHRAVWLLSDCGPLLAADVQHGDWIESRFKAAGLIPPRIKVRRTFVEAAQ